MFNQTAWFIGSFLPYQSWLVRNKTGTKQAKEKGKQNMFEFYFDVNKSLRNWILWWDVLMYGKIEINETTNWSILENNWTIWNNGWIYSTTTLTWIGKYR